MLDFRREGRAPPSFLMKIGDYMKITEQVASFAEPVVTLNFLALTVFSSLFGYLIWNNVLKQLGTVLASNYIYGIPLVTIITAVIALGERITAMAIAGTAAIIAGIFSRPKPFSRIS